jgi:hypothetical protein
VQTLPRLAPTIDQGGGYASMQITVTPWRFIKQDTERRNGVWGVSGATILVPVELGFVEIK